MRSPIRFSGQHEWNGLILPDPLSLVRNVALIFDHAVLNFEFRRCGAHVNELIRHLHEFVEIERPIIERARQTKSVLDQHGFARAIAFVHATDLRNRGVRFIDHHEKIFREEIDDCVWLRSGWPSR